LLNIWSNHAEGAADGFNEVVCQLVIASCVSETVRTSDGKHTVYCLRAVMIGSRGTDRKSWEVRRRYSEFHDLHTRMKALGAVHSGERRSAACSTHPIVGDAFSMRRPFPLAVLLAILPVARARAFSPLFLLVRRAYIHTKIGMHGADV